MPSNLPIYLLIFLIAFMTGAASADTAVIKYRSGKVQTIKLDEPSSGILSISYGEDSSPNNGAHPKLQSKPGAREAEGKAEPAVDGAADLAGKNKQQIRLEWAQPLE